MSENNDDRASVQVETPLGKLGISGGKGLNETLNLVFTMLAAIVACLILWLITEHKDESHAALKENTQMVERSLQELGKTNKQLLEVQREQLCLLALPQEKRERELTGSDSFCKRISR